MTSSTVVSPAAIFSAPLTRSGFMPSRMACSRTLLRSVSALINRRCAGLNVIIS